jgi:hypothetical protein
MVDRQWQEYWTTKYQKQQAWMTNQQQIEFFEYINKKMRILVLDKSWVCNVDKLSYFVPP